MIESIAVGTIGTGIAMLGTMATRMVVDYFKKAEIKTYTKEDVEFFIKNSNIFRTTEEDRKKIIYPEIVDIRETERVIELEFKDEFFMIKQYEERQELFQNYFKEAQLVEFKYNQDRHVVVTIFKEIMKSHYNFKYVMCPDDCFFSGYDLYENETITSLRRNMLLAGGTGFGKSSTLQGIILNRLWNNVNNPSTIGTDFLLGDLKGTDMSHFRGFRGVEKVATTVEEFKEMLEYAKAEMDRRNNIFKQNKISNIEEFNQKSKDKMRYKCLVVDEIATLQQLDKKLKDEIEKILMVLVSKSRSAGIMVVISIQRPCNSSINSFIKSQVSGTIVTHKVANKATAEVVGVEEAESLLRAGQAWVVGDNGKIMTQMAYLSTKELKMRLAKDIKRH